MARIDYFDLAKATGLLRDAIDRRPPLNIYRMAAHGGVVGAAFMRMAGAILYESTLDRRLRELIILRVGAHCRSEYELAHHRRIARSVGVSPAQIEAILAAAPFAPPPGVFDREMIDLVGFVDEVISNVKADDHRFEKLRSRYSEQVLVEITITIGFYQMVCTFLENLEVDMEDDTAP